MQARKHSALLHTFDFSIQVERQCAFVAANTRVAPVKPLSIPRLELGAAAMSAQLVCMIQKEHDYEVSSTYCWSNSSAVIGHILGVKATCCFHCQQAFRNL